MSTDNRFVIHIDGRPLYVGKGLTILQAARQNGIEIPTLCDFPGLPSPGSCRMCIVEIQGRENTPTSCTTPVEEGMDILTHSPKVQALRAELLQMLLAEHPSACFYCLERERCDECMVTLRKAGVTTGCGSCPKDGQCELQSLAEEYIARQPVYPIRYRMLAVEKHDPFFDRDDNLCILCGRCIRICESRHFSSSLAFTRRGASAVVGTAFYHTQLESGCTFCGSCVEVCPTGALTEKMRKWDGKPASETTSTCPLCSLGCQVRLLAKQERVIGALAGCKEQNELCVKGRFGLPELVNPPSRLKRPQRRLGDTLQQASWEEAIRQAAEKLAACPPERFEMQVSACCTTEDLYVAHQFAREVMKGGAIHFTGTAGGGEGLEDFSRLLQQSRSLEAIDGAQAIFCLGLDDPYAQTVIEARLHRARQRGARLILCSDPGHPWRKYADHWLSTEDGEALRRLETLVARPGAEQPGGADGPAQIARLLQSSSSPLFILGPGILYRPQNRLLLRWLERLLGSLGAPAIVFSDPVNLRGALRLGLRPAKPSSERNDLDVLYLIGEAVPAHLSAKPFILYQNLYLPAGENPPHLLLPTTAFSEEQGTYIDYAGRVAFIHPAVAAPGEALPSWMILSRIAQYLGVQGFEYASVEDIWRAARAEIPEFPAFPPSAAQVPPLQAGEAVSWKELDLSLLDPPGGSSYMGYPLTQWVEGLRSLYPEKTREGIHEPHS